MKSHSAPAKQIGKQTARTILMASVLLALTWRLPAAAAEDGSTTQPRETITFFYYDDLEAQRPFYEGLLGLEKTMDEDWVKIYRITESSSLGLVLNGHGLHSVSDSKPAMLSIVTDDVDGWYARLQGAGVQIIKPLPPPESGPRPGRAPVRGFIAADPGGYTIEFFTWLQPSTP